MHQRPAPLLLSIHPSVSPSSPPSVLVFLPSHTLVLPLFLGGEDSWDVGVVAVSDTVYAFSLARSLFLSLCADSGLLTNASSHLGTLGNLCYHFVSRMTEAVNVSNSPRDREPSC